MMWGQKAARIAELEARNTYLAEQLELARKGKAPQVPAPLRTPSLANQLHARTLQRDAAIRAQQEAETALARIRGGGLYRQIRATANEELALPTTYAKRAVRDFARDLETWIPEDAGDPQSAAGDCPACDVGIEHTEHCPTPETHNWGCGCPTDPCAHGCQAAADEHTRLSQELDAGEAAP